MEIKEMEIEVPWGHIAAKLWGNQENPSILCVHGVMDNANSFDGLIPLLPDAFFYICIDLPGHGKSDHFPPHLPIHTINYIPVYTLVMDYFQKDKYIIMGHSYGGQLGNLFAQIYPNRVEKLIMLDTIRTIPYPTNYFAQILEDRFHKLMEFQKKQKTQSRPEYTYEEAVGRIMKGRIFPLTEKAARALSERALIPVENDKYVLSLDQRLKFFISPEHDNRYVVETLKHSPVTCPVLMVLAKENKIQRQYLRETLDYFKTRKNIIIKYVEGHHDVHQTHPERVVPLVMEFLLNQKNKL